jgi:kinesin family protein 1
MSDSVKVAVRCRPFNDRENKNKPRCIVQMVGSTTTLLPAAANEKEYKFNFDFSYWSHDKNDVNFAVRVSLIIYY